MPWISDFDKKELKLRWDCIHSGGLCRWLKVDWTDFTSVKFFSFYVKISGNVKVCSINFKSPAEPPWMNAIPAQLWPFLLKIGSSWHNLIHNACPKLPKRLKTMVDPIQAGVFVIIFCFSFICCPITTKLGIMVLWHITFQRQ